ncbi:RNA polymerase sigma-70 factor [Arenibacter sp. ARW7G5Y1]|uniref:RNA polymerase sigma-70 factor n=1 Tax=Arenibacter sp. ARW7G5Y1 TaxID=2135619 RepID=UPI000D772733|nr:RNA polymerase sigma-70 factor [Arenibacter sp. ARW7G5Y1]PXX25406.1 RNA polymerase sigma-70 factor (ECF subfamily) [Arenibacter sp. ARW7G5Y1]|tara:strand:+ start:86318 stop:86908 length:591 start_codon:yes stop_codon:yes gene_type:complete
MRFKEHTPDEFLISELKNNKEEAFDCIFRRYYKGLCAYATNYVYDLDKAQSLVQDCFIKLWANRDRADSIENLPAYLSQMVRNRCIDHIRQLKSIEKLHEKLELEEFVINAENSLLSREFEEILINAISTLPKKSKMAFEYSRFENLTYKEIGVKMNISSKAVEALLSRALKLLRKDLQPYFVTLILALMFWFSKW